MAALLYTVQIYADFSGCVDIARGTAEVFDIRMTQNFNAPYLSQSIQEFWRRWHISLSSWLRDYIYIPLGGSRKGMLRRWLNVFIVFAVSGFWHGVGFRFLTWGLVHAAYQLLGFLLMPLRKLIRRILKIDMDHLPEKIFRMFFTFMLVDLAWVIFRAPTMADAWGILKQILFHPDPWVLTDGSLYTFGLSGSVCAVLVCFIILLLLVDIANYKGIVVREVIRRQHFLVRAVIYEAAILSIAVFGVYGLLHDASAFIYMAF